MAKKKAKRKVTNKQVPKVEALASDSSDLSVESQAEHLHRLRQEDDALKQSNTVFDKWYEVRSGKVIFCQKKKLGSVYRSFTCKVAGNEDFIEELRERGDLR